MHDDIESIMSEGPGGLEPSDEEFAAGGFTVLVPSRGGREAADTGMTAHRGILHPDEYVDQDVLRGVAAESLGYSYADISAAYKAGRPTDEQRQHRDRIDARLLALSRDGGSMKALAAVLDLSEKTIDRALQRARAVEVTPIVKNPAVKTRCVSFLTGKPGAQPRRRRHKGCPSHMLPMEGLRVSTVNLTAAEYWRGA